MISTDGDSQETSQLDLALMRYFPSAVRTRCIWHIVDRGMKTWYPTFRTVHGATGCSKECHDKVRDTVRRWIFSWASPGHCETHDEFTVSKGLFLAYLSSAKVAKVLGKNGVEEVKLYHRKHVEPLEEHFVFYTRRALLAFETNSNSAQEGTNNGLKHHSAAVKPTHGLMKATKTLTFQGTVNDIDRKISGAQKVESQSLWSTLPSANDITTLGEALLTTQWKEKDNYVVLAIKVSNQWLLVQREWKISQGPFLNSREYGLFQPAPKQGHYSVPVVTLNGLGSLVAILWQSSAT